MAQAAVGGGSKSVSKDPITTAFGTTYLPLAAYTEVRLGLGCPLLWLAPAGWRGGDTG